MAERGETEGVGIPPAELVRKSDPDRFSAAMAGSELARRVLFPVYAFNIEVARAPWMSKEPLIAEMRLTWWRDALEEIQQGQPVRRHEVATPLAEVINAEGAAILSDLVDARRWDIGTEPHVTVKMLIEYLDRTAGNLMWAGARMLGADADAEDDVRDLARGIGLVRYLAAVPTLEARGKRPLPLGTNVANLAEAVLDDMPEMPIKDILPRPARAALYEATGAKQALAEVVRSPKKVERGQVALPTLRRRAGLIKRSFGF